MNKVTVTITGMDKKIVSYIAKKIRPVPGGLCMELDEPALPPPPSSITKKEIIVLTPFYTDRSPLPLSFGYKALIPRVQDFPKEYRFRSPFSLREVLLDIQKKFALSLMDRPIMFCVKRKGTGKEGTLDGNWRGTIQYIEQGEEH